MKAPGALMAAFFANLGGKSKAEALRLAQKAIREDGKHGHPYYWAPSCSSAIGDADASFEYPDPISQCQKLPARSLKPTGNWDLEAGSFTHHRRVK